MMKEDSPSCQKEAFRVFRHLNHDVGFMYLLSCGADCKLTGDDQARIDTLHAASLLMGRFNPAGFIRAWNHPSQAGFAIIDCMMNLSLLFWASRQTGDPRFANAAVSMRIPPCGSFCARTARSATLSNSTPPPESA